jgi:hypothetical protein
MFFSGDRRILQDINKKYALLVLQNSRGEIPLPALFRNAVHFAQQNVSRLLFTVKTYCFSYQLPPSTSLPPPSLMEAFYF